MRITLPQNREQVPPIMYNFCFPTAATQTRMEYSAVLTQSHSLSARVPYQFCMFKFHLIWKYYYEQKVLKHRETKSWILVSERELSLAVRWPAFYMSISTFQCIFLPMYELRASIFFSPLPPLISLLEDHFSVIWHFHDSLHCSTTHRSRIRLLRDMKESKLYFGRVCFCKSKTLKIKIVFSSLKRSFPTVKPSIVD